MSNRVVTALLLLLFSMVTVSGCGSKTETNPLMGGAVQGKALTVTGTVSTLAGSSVASTGWTDGPAFTARFNAPDGVTTDGRNLYITEMRNNTVRKVVIATGETTTLAGNPNAPAESKDGIGAAATFNAPLAITCDGTNLYVTEFNAIRKIVIATGQVATLAGGVDGMADGVGSAARFWGLRGITTDGRNLYVVDTLNHAVRKVEIATGAVTTLARVEAVAPAAITTDGVSLYVTDWNSSDILRIVIATCSVTTLAHNVTGFGVYQGITTDGTYLYLFGTDTLYKLAIATGAVTTLAENLVFPGGITTDGTSLYYADTYVNTINVIR